jgi:hypothetical protein
LLGVGCPFWDALRPVFTGIVRMSTEATGGDAGGRSHISPEGHMPKRTKYLVFASLLLGMPSTTLPARAAPAADECLSAPNHQPSEGSHWYYHVDRTSNRKCWYLRPAGEEVRSIAPKPEPRHVPVTQPGAARHVEQPATPILAAAPVVGNAQGIDQATEQRIIQPDVQDVTGSARGRNPANADVNTAANTASTETAGADAAWAAEPQSDVPLKEQSYAQATMTAPEPGSALGSRLMLALLAGALVISGTVGRLMFRRSRLRIPRPRDIVARAYVAPSSSESILPILTRASAPEAPAETHYSHETTVATAPAAISWEEDVAWVPEQDGVDRQHGPEVLDRVDEIDLLLRELELLSQRSAA